MTSGKVILSWILDNESYIWYHSKVTLLLKSRDIMIDIEQATCKNCGRPIPQSRGSRKREYCDNSKCKQAVYRQRKEQQAKELVAKLKRENEELKARLDVEERFRIDTRKRHFKSWLQSHPP